VQGDKGNVDLMIGHLFRHEAGKMAAVLTRFLGVDHIDTAQDLVQDTLLKAMETWRFRGMPDNPTAWLYKVARNKAIDWLREQQRKAKHSKEAKSNTTVEELFHEDEIQDSVLRMMFTCCHPSIQTESQIALTLRTLGGLSVAEIANAFLTTEDTIAKRIYRAKEKIKQDNIKLEPPGLYETPARLDSVLHVLYLLFNEGYHSSHGDTVIREDLCAEAMRLTYLLVQHKSTSLPKVKALMALMCLQSSRFVSRTGELGQIILLEDQDRSKWNQELITRGLNFLEQSSSGDLVSEYHVEASIASVHALANRFENTRWDTLVKLYEILGELKPGPMTSLNHAIAIGYAVSPQQGIIELEKIESLKDHYLYLCAMGNFYLLSGKSSDAKEIFEKALQKPTSLHEAELLKRNLEKCSEF
jgi:RNA polymerase sigma factor (sigma-70 family)